METMLVTGGAGFIGCNFVRYALAHTEARVIVIDKLTYAGSSRSLDEVAHHPRFTLTQADIRIAGQSMRCSLSISRRRW
jgi:dTDP-glucose 4,6-dehydratase